MIRGSGIDKPPTSNGRGFSFINSTGHTMSIARGFQNNQRWNHQVLGTQLIERQNCILNWDMGCGKTRAVIDHIIEHGVSMTLVVCPKKVIPVWPHEFAKHSDKPINILALDSGSSSRSTKQLKRFDTTHPYNVVVVNYESAWRGELAGIISSIKWSLIVCDEVHKIKSPSGRASKYIASLNAKRKIGLTGTVMTHGPLDVWAICRFVDPSVFSWSFTRFKSRYAIPHRYIRGAIVGYKNLDDLTTQLAPLTHRVVRDEAIDLPDAVHQTFPVRLSTTGQLAYGQMERDMIAKIDQGIVTASNAMIKVLRLQQITSGFIRSEDGDHDVDLSKAAALQEILDDLPRDEPVVVFARFTHDVGRIMSTAKLCGRNGYELSGGANRLSEWQDGSGSGDVLAVQIQAGGLGIDLTRARYCIYYSVGYSWGDYVQSLARIHRPGQHHKVTYIHLIATDTVDEQVYDALSRKEDVIKSVVNHFTRSPV